MEGDGDPSTDDVPDGDAEKDVGEVLRIVVDEGVSGEVEEDEGEREGAAPLSDESPPAG